MRLPVLNEREVYAPVGAMCEKCQEPIAFYKITSGKAAGKWCPCNPDGSDHWDLCREVAIKKGLKPRGVDHYCGGLTLGRYPVLPVECAAAPFIVEHKEDCPNV